MITNVIYLLFFMKIKTFLTVSLSNINIYLYKTRTELRRVQKCFF